MKCGHGPEEIREFGEQYESTVEWCGVCGTVATTDEELSPKSAEVCTHENTENHESAEPDLGVEWCEDCGALRIYTACGWSGPVKDFGWKDPKYKKSPAAAPETDPTFEGAKS